MHLFKRLTIRFIAFIFIVGLVTYLILAFLSSLYVTIPVSIPFFNSIPVHRNQWQYIAPSQLTQPNPNLNAAYITFVKDTDSLGDLRLTIRNIEDVFNKHHKYPYIIFSAQDLSIEYKELVSSLTEGDVLFEKVSKSEYGYGKTTDYYKAFLSRKQLKISDGNTEEFLFKSRLMAGTIYKHQSLNKLDYFWRFEPGTEYMCPIDFDPFQYMQDHGKQLSFSIATYEQQEKIPSLFKKIMKFKDAHPEWISDQPNEIMSAMIDTDGQYNGCFFWNNFQIAKTSFFQSPAYQAYFDYIDKQNGIFYERWADPVIQSLAAALFLNKDQIQIWQDIGYKYDWFFTHCPKDKSIWKKCYCRPEQNVDHDSQSCLSHFE